MGGFTFPSQYLSEGEVVTSPFKLFVTHGLRTHQASNPAGFSAELNWDAIAFSKHLLSHTPLRSTLYFKTW